MGDELKYYRQALGINMIWNAYPIVFIVRDSFGIGPAGSAFTVLYWVVGLLFLIPFNIFTTIYSPNRILLISWLSFWALGLAYWHYYPSPNTGTERTRETLTYVIPIIFLFGLMFYPPEKSRYILVIMVFYTLFASVGLLYGIAHDPNWHFGERAAIKFNANTNNSNPHAFANNAICTIIASLVVVGKVNGFFKKIFYYLAAIFSLGILVLTRTNSSFISLGLMAFVFLFFNGKSIIKGFFQVKVLATIAAIWAFLVFLMSQFTFATYALSAYFQTFAKRFNNVIYTFSGIQVDEEQVAEIDNSSINRVYSFKYFREIFLGEEASLGKILFGEGYKAQFFDVPSLEAVVNQGILGFLFFDGFFFLLAITSLQQFMKPASDLSKFMAYFSIVLILGIFSGARPIDLSMWLVYVFYIRFFGIYSFKKSLS